MTIDVTDDDRRFAQRAMRCAVVEQLADGSYCDTVRGCPGVIAFGPTAYAVREQLPSILEEWHALGRAHLPSRSRELYTRSCAGDTMDVKAIAEQAAQEGPETLRALRDEVESLMERAHDPPLDFTLTEEQQRFLALWSKNWFVRGTWDRREWVARLRATNRALHALRRAGVDTIWHAKWVIANDVKIRNFGKGAREDIIRALSKPLLPPMSNAMAEWPRKNGVPYRPGSRPR